MVVAALTISNAALKGMPRYSRGAASASMSKSIWLGTAPSYLEAYDETAARVEYSDIGRNFGAEANPKNALRRYMSLQFSTVLFFLLFFFKSIKSPCI